MTWGEGNICNIIKNTKDEKAKFCNFLKLTVRGLMLFKLIYDDRLYSKLITVFKLPLFSLSNPFFTHFLHLTLINV